jgi:hypothetical protein
MFDYLIFGWFWLGACMDLCYVCMHGYLSVCLSVCRN